MYQRLLILFTLKYVGSEMTGHIIGGDYANVHMYPHAVFLEIYSEFACMCGGSILNQDIVLTAAHCFDEYKGRLKDSVNIKYGDSALASMKMTVMRFYRIHENYNEFSMTSDISLLKCKKRIRLGRLAKRVVLMRSPPRETWGYVSGWGSMNEKQELPKSLKHVQQQIHSTSMCMKYLNLPEGTLCAGPLKGVGHPDVGDSGGALVTHQFVQIGIVSFKEEHYSIVVYTNVSYYYRWIKNNAAFTYCKT